MLGYSVLAGVATIAGTLLVLYRYKWARHNSIHLMSFAAGIMLALAFLHLIPETIHMAHGNEEHNGEGEFIFIIVLLGFAIFHAIESIVMIHPRHDVEAEEAHKHGRLSLIAITGSEPN